MCYRCFISQNRNPESIKICQGHDRDGILTDESISPSLTLLLCKCLQIFEILTLLEEAWTKRQMICRRHSQIHCLKEWFYIFFIYLNSPRTPVSQIIIKHAASHFNVVPVHPDSQVHWAKMGPPGSCRSHMGPMLAHEPCYPGIYATLGHQLVL